ncbi:hypothetical protein [Pontibacter ummariensis]|uniref:hypothetical protein n=1 Tax=Pontibacter ummariensis TaxID=1610492 RepID=UPI001C63A66C|nr:hypothetical protein [Pontibacter ummariensis]
MLAEFGLLKATPVEVMVPVLLTTLQFGLPLATTPDKSNVVVLLVPTHFAAVVAEAEVTAGCGLTVKTPESLALPQVLLSVTTTLYVPATLAEKLATSPGSAAPLGTVHL